MKLSETFVSSRRNAAILGAFAIVTTLAIVLTFALTEQRIEQQKQAKLLEVIFEVVEADMISNAMQHNCMVLPTAAATGNKTGLKAYRGLNAQQQLTALAVQSVAPNGYSGDIRFLVGLAQDLKTVTGVRVLEHQETPGLGDKIDVRISDWILDFAGQSVTPDNQMMWTVRKEGGQFDAFTGATITPRALTQAIYRTVRYVQAEAALFRSAPNTCNSQEPNT